MLPALLFLSRFLQRGGVQTWVTFAFFGIYFPMMLVISRLRAQLGPPNHDVNFVTPNLVLPALVGTQALGPRTLGMFTMLSPFLMEHEQPRRPAVGGLPYGGRRADGALAPRPRPHARPSRHHLGLLLGEHWRSATRWAWPVASGTIRIFTCHPATSP